MKIQTKRVCYEVGKMKNKLVMAMITVVLASECFAGCSKKQ